MEAIDLLDCPAATDEPAWWPAAFAIGPIPWIEKPPRVANSAMIAKKDRIRFMMLLVSACLYVFQAGKPYSFRLSLPFVARLVFAIEWAHRDQITGVSVGRKPGQRNAFHETVGGYMGNTYWTFYVGSSVPCNGVAICAYAARDSR